MKRLLVAAILLASPRPHAASLPTLYTLHCSGCHGAAGHGVPERGIPDLHDAGLYAGLPAGRAYLAQVPGLTQSRLDNPTAARMLNYVLTHFSADNLPADFHPYTTAEIATLHGQTVSDAPTRRQALLAAIEGKKPR